MKQVFFTVFYILLGSPAGASELLYTPINPTFGGNPLNSTQLLGVAAAQKPNPPTTPVTQQSASQQFLQMLQSQLYAGLASSVSNAITGQNAQESGKVQLGTTQVSWYTALDGKHITMTDTSSGQVTQITIPVVSVN